MKVKWMFGVLVFGLMGLVNTSYAALSDLNNGLINDDGLNITWMKDANLVKTSCDANNALWQAFNPSTLPSAQQSGRTKAEICNADPDANGSPALRGQGTLNWYEAQAWIAVLNAQKYLGYEDWRLPNVIEPDSSCSSSADATGDNCIGSELGNLFKATLGNGNHTDNTCFLTSPYCFASTGPFQNTLPVGAQNIFGGRWAGTTYSTTPTNAFLFNTSNGGQNFGHFQANFAYVWPVRPALSVPVVPLPQQVPTLSIWGLGLMSLLLAFVARRKVR